MAHHPQETCVTVKIPVVVGEATVQHIVQSITHIIEGAIKIDHIEASIKELDWDVLDGKVVFHGVIHKQIFFVSKENFVRHQAEDVQFSGHAVIPGAMPDMEAQVTAAIRRPIQFQLLTRSRLEQHVLLDVMIRVVKTEELLIPLLGSITGQVILNGAPQILAPVAVFDSMWRLIHFTFTNNNGAYRFVSLPPGEYLIVATQTGVFELKRATVEACKETTVNFFQTPSTDCTAILPGFVCTLLSGLLGMLLHN